MMHTIVILTDGDGPNEHLKKVLKQLFPECRIEVRFKDPTKAGQAEREKPRQGVPKR